MTDCDSTTAAYRCELERGHDGPHRVRYWDEPDKVWDDGDLMAEPENEYEGHDNHDDN